MKNVIITFEKLGGVMPEQMQNSKIKTRYKFFPTHMVFGIKMYGKFMSKACLVTNGHKMDAPASITSSSVVSRDIVRIAFLIVLLNYLDICACDIRNVYLNIKLM